MPTSPDFNLLLQAFSFKNLGFNLIDIIIIIVFLFYAFEGFEVGFIAAFLDLVSFVLSFALGIKFYGLIGLILIRDLSFSTGFANAISFFLIAFVSEIILNIIFHRIIYHAILEANPRPKNSKENVNYAYLKSINQFLGIFPGIASAFVLLSFILTVILAFPFSSTLKHVISSSKISNLLVANTQGFEKTINNIFGGAIDETINFFTIKPQSDETVNLNFTASNASEDEEAEKQMFILVNKERTVRGLSALVIDSKLKQVALVHAKDMFDRGYFSHYTPEGYSPFDRMAAADITYSYAGENLALAPNVSIAMQGLMNSPGHKANILSPNFGRIGIGVIDGGVYGEMFVQEFKD